MTVLEMPEKRDRIEDMKGCKRFGYSVVVEGREIPLLSMIDEVEHIHLTLDNRLSIDIPRDYAPQVAWLVANALAIGQGYPSLNAQTKDMPFAPSVVHLEAVS